MTTPAFTLGEGHTPLIRSRQIGPKAGMPQLYFKLESLNPTGSYKDRFAAAAVADMIERGETRAVASSSGNAGAALAACCAAAGIACEIAVVHDAPAGKLKQMAAYGAQLRKIDQFGIDPQTTGQVLQTLVERGRQPGSRLQVSAYCHSPIGMAGVETISHELVDQSRDQPIDHVFVCAGGGGLILAVARGFETMIQHGELATGPKVHCVQPEGNDTMASPLREGLDQARTCPRSTTRISGLQVPSVLDGHEAVRACRRSGGTGHLVADDVVEAIQARLAREEGIFCEPAAAVALAGALQAVADGLISPDEKIVCLVTGTGFKDPAAIDRMAGEEICPRISLAEFQSLTHDNPIL